MKLKVFNFNILQDIDFTEEFFKKVFEDLFDIDFHINIIFINRDDMKALNKEFRGIDKETDVLSFGPYGSEGEVYVCPEVSDDIVNMAIHGVLHLQGWDHEDEMYNIQERHLKNFYDILKNK